MLPINVHTGTVVAWMVTRLELNLGKIGRASCRAILFVGGNKIKSPIDCGTPTADLFMVKLLLNSAVLTNGAKFFTLDIKNFYLNTPMERFEYMRLKMEDIPENVIENYELKSKEEDGQVYVEIRKGFYGLPQAGVLAQKLL